MSNGRKKDHQTNMAVLQKYREATAKSGSSSNTKIKPNTLPKPNSTNDTFRKTNDFALPKLPLEVKTKQVTTLPELKHDLRRSDKNINLRDYMNKNQKSGWKREFVIPEENNFDLPKVPLSIKNNHSNMLPVIKQDLRKSPGNKPLKNYINREQNKGWGDFGENKLDLIKDIKGLPNYLKNDFKSDLKGTGELFGAFGTSFVAALKDFGRGIMENIALMSTAQDYYISGEDALAGMVSEEVRQNNENKVNNAHDKVSTVIENIAENQIKSNEELDNKIKKYDIDKKTKDAMRTLGYGTGGVLPLAIASAIDPNLGSYTIFQSSFINSLATAKNEGATDDEAFFFATLNGLKDLTAEKAVGGIAGIKGVGDDAIEKAISKLFSNKAFQKFVVSALKTGGEGIEEDIALIGERYIKKKIYDPDAPMPTFEELRDAFIVGTAISGITQVPGMAVNGIKKLKGNLEGEKAANKYNLLPAAEKPVNTLPPAGAFKEDNGNFDLLPPEGAFKEKNGNFDSLPEPGAFGKANIPKVVHSTDIPIHLRNTVENIKNRTALDVVLGRRYNADGSIDNGFRGYVDGNKIVVSENATKRDIFNTIILHELTHSIEGTNQYSEIEKYIIDKKYGGDIESFNRDKANKIEEYKLHDKIIDDSGAKAEIIASNVEEYIFTDDVKSIVEQDYTFGQKMYDFITELIYKIKNKYGTAVDIDHLKNAQRKYRQALDEVRKNGVSNISSEQYDIYDMGDHRRVVVTNDIVNEIGINTRSKIKKFIDRVYDEIEVSLHDGTSGITYVTERGAKEYAYSEYSKGLKGTIKYDKFRMADNIDEIIKAQIESEYENPNHLRDDDIVGFYRSPIEVQVGNRLYDCELVTGITKDGREEFYDVVNMNLKNKNEPHPTLANRISVNGRLDADSFKHMIPQNKTIVNNNYMQNDDNNATKQKTDFEIAYEKALEKKRQDSGQYSFTTEQNPETGKFTDESGNEYENVAPEAEEFGVRILEGKDNTGKDILEIDVDNPDIDSVISSEEYKRLIENAFDIKEVRGNTLTAERAFEKAFGKNYESFRKVVYDNLDKSKLQYMNVLDYLTKGLEENVVKRGIKKGSKDSELMQKYGEGLITQSELMSMTDNWQNIVEADRYMRQMYDALIDSINATKKKIYPYIEEQEAELRNDLDEVNRKLDLIEQGELTTAMPINKANKVQRARYLENAIANIEKNAERSMSVIDKQINSVQEAMGKKINTGTKAYAELENRLTNLKAKQKRLKEFFELSKAKKQEQLENLLDEYKDSDDLLGGIGKKVKEDLEAKRNRIEDDLNDELRWRGKRIPKRKDYYHHFQEFSNSILGELLNKGNSNISAELVLVSEHTKPKAKWESFAQRRRGTDTVYDAVGGYLDYIDAAAYAMTIDPNISIIRKLTDDIKHETSSSNPNTYGTNNANGLILRLDALANELAGKTVSKIDRDIQEAITRKNFRLAKNIVNRMKAAAIVGNAGSAVVQVSNLPNTIGTLENKTNIVAAISDSWAEVDPGKNNLYDAIMNRTEIQKQSPFLRERYFDSKSQFDSGILSNVKKFTTWMLTVGDEASTRLSWNAFYREALSKGVENPIQYADSKTRKVVGGRGLGEKSLAQQSATLTAAFPFTLEVSNAWQVQKDMAKDLYKGIKQGDIKQASKGVGDFLALYISTALIAAALKEIRGSDGGMFNPVGIIFKNLCDYFFGDDEEDKENVFLKTTQEVAGNFVGSLPTGQIIASYLDEETRKEVFGSEDPMRYGDSSLVKDSIERITDFKRNPSIRNGVNAVSSFVPGGSQIRKTAGAIDVLKDGGVYDNKGKLKYPVEKNAENVTKGLLFGKSAFDETKEFYDEDKKAFTTDETKEYEYRVEQGENPQDVYNEIYQRKIDSAAESDANKAYREKTDGMVNEFDYGTSLKLDNVVREYQKTNPKASSLDVPKASREFSYNGKNYTLTEEQCADLQNRYNEAYYEGVEWILNDIVLPDAEKYKRISKVRQSVQEGVKKQFAREELVGTQNKPTLREMVESRQNKQSPGGNSNTNKSNGNKPTLKEMLDSKNKISFKDYKVTNNNGGKHKGMDFAVPEGTAIQSTTSGVVTEVLSLKDSYGKYIVVRDSSGNNHYYAHLSGFNCKIGDKVNRGQVIGYSGNTGNSSGPHLHYEVRVGDDYGRQIDPRSYL